MGHDHKSMSGVALMRSSLRILAGVTVVVGAVAVVVGEVRAANARLFVPKEKQGPIPHDIAFAAFLTFKELIPESDLDWAGEDTEKSFRSMVTSVRLFNKMVKVSGLGLSAEEGSGLAVYVPGMAPDQRKSMLTIVYAWKLLPEEKKRVFIEIGKAIVKHRNFMMPDEDW